MNIDKEVTGNATGVEPPSDKTGGFRTIFSGAVSIIYSFPEEGKRGCLFFFFPNRKLVTNCMTSSMPWFFGSMKY
jgi:hypothetical protein